MRAVIVDVLVAAGVLVLIVCALGVLVMPNAYDRLHYGSAAGWGVALIAVAILVRESFSLVADKALATAAVAVACGPLLGHVTARAARIRERGAWNADEGVCELRDRAEERP